MTIENKAAGDIAIIGMACRFPGDAKSPDEFFEMLLEGRNGWSEVPKDRFNIDSYYHPSNERRGSITCRGGHYLTEDLGLFDAPFFSMSAGEANAMEPQHRLLLEVVYEGIENAGIPMHKIIGSDTACYVGAFTEDYKMVAATDLTDCLLYTPTGTGFCMMSNRLSWFYDLHGPSMTLDTACSSSLVALHQACTAIRNSESGSRQAIVAGTNLILIPDHMTAMNPVNFLSRDSHCFSFDDRANGYVRGEGLGVLIIKHMEDAIRDGDCIRAVIRSTGVNQDGRTPGITIPSSKAHQSLIESVYRSAGLNTADTPYVEAHGTGTAVGDPIEIAAIAGAFDRTAPGAAPLYVGSVKPNVGHLEAAAGMSAIIKSILSMERGIIPPNVNFINANPKLLLNERNIKIPVEPTPWPAHAQRRASINCFGYGGTNAHVIVDDAYQYLIERGLSGRTSRAIMESITERASSQKSDSGISVGEDDGAYKQRLFVLSAPDQAALSRLAKQHSEYFAKRSNESQEWTQDMLDSLAFTYSERRSVFKWRSSFIAQSSTQLAEQLGKAPKPIQAGKLPGLLFCFTGQGAQWYAMGRELLAYEVYLQSIQAANTYLTKISGWSVLEELQRTEETTRINEPECSQTLCTVVQIALVDLLRHWGASPNVVIGHSSGEIAAAYALGALSAQDCWMTAYHRGRLAGQVKIISPGLKGGMMAVGLSAEEVEPYISKLGLAETALCIACINSPSSVTISGDIDALAKLEDELKSNSVFARQLKVENAYHSWHMSCVADQYRESIKDIQPKDPDTGTSCTMLSSVTGQPIDPKDLGPDYWVSNMENPVRFAAAVEAAFPAKGSRRMKRGAAAPVDTILEVGPHSALQGPIQQTLKALKMSDNVSYMSVLGRNKSGIDTALDVAGKCWERGVFVDINKVNSWSKDCPSVQIPLCNLPKYPWNHGHKYWHESQHNTNNRFRHAPRTDLLGEPVLGFSWTEPMWKNNLRISEQPWIADHALSGQVLLPAASMICAAIEAVRQIADQTKTLRSIELRDVVIGRALVFPSSDPGLKVLTKLKPQRHGIKDDPVTWFEWNFTSLNESSAKSGQYVEHASGLVALVYETDKDVDKTIQESLDQRDRQAYCESLERCTVEVSSDEHYKQTKSGGFEYGPMFQGLKSARYCNGEATVVLGITDTKSVMPANFEYPFLLHPTTLDATLQGAFQAARRDRGKPLAAMVPTGFSRISVSSKIPHEPLSELIGLVTSTTTGLRNIEANMKLSTEDWPETLLEIEKFSLTGLGEMSGQEKEGALSSMRKVGSSTLWKPAIELLELQDVQRLCSEYIDTAEDTTTAFTLLVRAAIVHIKRVLAQITPDIEAQISGHFVHLFHWMKERLQIAKDRQILYQRTENGQYQDWVDTSFEEDESVLESLGKISQIDGKLLGAIARNLPDILIGKQKPLSLMLEENMLNDMYANAYGLKDSLKVFKPWFDLLVHKYPNLSILEVGAGTGSLTSQILETIGGKDGKTPRLGSYCFTDISPAFFPDAADLLKPWSEFLDFKRLDIEQNPLDQGFRPESFDILTASNVLHATKRIDNTLRNCYTLLKPGGLIVIGELTCFLDHTSLIFGTLPGWWLTEDGRDGGPLLSQSQWAVKLQEAGFESISHPASSRDIYGNAVLSMIVGRKPFTLPPPLSKVILVEPIKRTSNGDALVESLRNYYSAIDIATQTIILDEAEKSAKQGDLDGSGTVVISLAESFHPFFARCSEKELESTRSLILQSNKLFWVNCNVTEDGVRHPDSCAISGLLCSVRAENHRISPQQIHLKSRDIDKSLVTAQLIARIVDKVFNSPDADEYENEVIEIDGLLQIPRIFDDKPMNRVLETLYQEEQPELQPLLQPGRPLKLEIGNVGQLDTLRFSDDPKAKEQLGDSEVEIEVKANSVNARDVSLAMGQVLAFELGLDGAGVVSKIGSGVAHLQPGDRVVFAKSGSMRTNVRIDAGQVQRLPESISFEQGAAIPVVLMAAYQSLVETARLAKGERILIHGAAGGLGQTMIALAQHLNAEIYVTVRSPQKKEALIKLGIAPSHIFSTNSLDFGASLKAATKGQGIDVIINTLSGEALRISLACLAPFGRFINLHLKESSGDGLVELREISPNVSYASVDIPYMLENAPHRAAKLLSDAFSLFRSGAIKVPSLTIHNYSDIAQVFRDFHHGSHVGKVVLSMTEKSLVRAPRVDLHPLQFNPDATYILVGGLGGIGRALALYMAEHGATNLALFSRTAHLTPERQQLLEHLESLGTRAVVYACDVADKDLLASTLKDIANELPPVRGIVQAAMQATGGIFETLDYKTWIRGTRPKIEGTWNLHELMPEDLDFFVILSSMVGASGGLGHSNYATGCSYQDALGHYRHSLGLPAQVLDLGAVSGMGWLEEHKGDHDLEKRMGLLFIEPEEVLAMFKSAVTGYTYGPDDKTPVQLFSGLGSGGMNEVYLATANQEYYWLKHSGRFAYLRGLDIGGVSKSEEGTGVNIKAALSAATSLEDAAQIVQNALASRLSKSMMVAVVDIDDSRPISSYGVDSLVAAEMRSWCFKEFKADISVFSFLSEDSLTVLASRIAQKSALVPAALKTSAE